MLKKVCPSEGGPQLRGLEKNFVGMGREGGKSRRKGLLGGKKIKYLREPSE